MPNIIVQGPGDKNFTFEVNKAEVALGRELKNDLILDDPRVSRHHAVIRHEKNEWVLRDLGSGNGTYLNGQRLPPNIDVKLGEGDTVKLGSCTLMPYLAEPLKTAVPTESFRQVLQKEANDLLTTSALNSMSASQEVPPLLYRREIEKKERILRLFYELSQKLGSVFQLKDIYEQVLDMLLQVTPASRAFVYRKTDQAGFARVAARLREGGEAGEPLPISKTIFDKVAAERVAVLLEDAQRGGTQLTSESIVLNQLQSIIAAPIVGRHGLLGIIYADRQDVEETFSADDLDLLNAVAMQTGIAINSADNYERLQKRARERERFERFLPRQVVEEILRAPDNIKLGGKRQIVTALFADVRNFTTLSEKSTPELIVSLLNRYFSMVSETIFRHGGTLDKYIGDGLMALFGAPFVGQLDPVQAVRAAIEMQREMVGFGERLVAEGLPRISIGIGINTGPAIVGYIGSETRLDYTAIGDTINTAARLESLAKPGQIIISENTMQALDESFTYRFLGTERLKGKNAQLKIAEVVWQ